MGAAFWILRYWLPVSTRNMNGQLSLSGARGIKSAISVDGADFNQPFFGGQRGGERSNFAYILGQEAIGEFRIAHSSFSAEFTQRRRCDQCGYKIRIAILEAFIICVTVSLLPNVFGFDTAPTRQQFGASLGGPLIKDKTFFFTVFDGQQEQPSRCALMLKRPNEIMRQGTFTTTNDVATYLQKIDHRLSSRNDLGIRYSFSTNKAANATNFGVTDSSLENNGTERDSTHTAIISLNSSVSTGIINEFGAHYSFESRPRTNNLENDDFKSIAGPEIRIVGCCALGGLATLPASQHDGRWQVADNLSLVKGRHHLKLGVDVPYFRFFQKLARPLLFTSLTIMSVLRKGRSICHGTDIPPFHENLF